MRTLVSGLSKLRDRWVGVTNSFDLFEDKTLFLVVRTEGGETIEQIAPNPSIKNTSPQMARYIERVNNVQVETDSYQVTGISKTYEEADLLRRGAYYVIGGLLVEGSLVGGIICDRYPGVDLMENTTSWSIVLRERQR
ncbi:hypothetical protein [Prochlorothrix hollandica]|uniref:hypothetical protein n=1 Tax=Prochlorothrix hollandica TaxID=1223 RepID=UPI003342CC67